MKQRLIDALKILVPVGIGGWLVYTQYHALSPAQRSELFAAIRQADLGWLTLATLVGWLAHVSRGWRWRYLLEPLGYRPTFWNAYHGVMVGYFLNMFVPRAGEASRAASLYRSEGVPFEKGFGTVMAERAVDMVMLLGIAVLAVLFQLDKLDLFRNRIAAFREGQGTAAEQGGGWGLWLLLIIVVALVAGLFLVLSKPALRARLMDLVRGFFEGVRAVFRMRQKGAFLLHTLLIWAAYLFMFQVGFYALDAMTTVPFAGVLAGFIAGAVGIVLVQGGIGVYPAFVALIIGVYLPAPEGGGLFRPDALAMGWLLWLAQTLMIIVLGGVSLLLMALKRKPAA